MEQTIHRPTDLLTRDAVPRLPSPAASVDELFERGERRFLAAGSILYRENDEPAEVFLLRSGEIELFVRSIERSRVATSGDILGITPVISFGLHLQTAMARTNCIVSALGAENFRRMIDGSPAVWFSTLRHLSLDLTGAYDALRHCPRLHSH